MCEPISMGITMATLAAVGGGVSAYSSYQQGKAEKAVADMQAEQYRQQAKLEQARAGQAQIAGEQEANKRALQLSQEIGSTYATFAGNGLELGTSGSVADALRTTAKAGGQDLSTIAYNTQMNVWGHLANAESYLNDAQIKNYEGRVAKKTGTLKAIGAGVSTLPNTVIGFSSGYDAGDKLKSWWQS